jgi:hypothetical protein
MLGKNIVNYFHIPSDVLNLLNIGFWILVLLRSCDLAQSPTGQRTLHLGLFAGTIEDIRAVTFFSALFFFFSLFLGLLSPILNTSIHILTQLYSIPEIIAIIGK